MGKLEKNIPAADTLMGSMRSMGYSFESAIADIIDNSISAKAKNIHLLFPTDPLQDLAVGIWDDGEGMDANTLFEAMRYGSSAVEAMRDEHDLGRFGLGLKSASLSQCCVLTVVSKKDDRLSAYSWDYNKIKVNKEWLIERLSEAEIAQLPYAHTLREMEHGTLVIWNDFDVIRKATDGQVYDTLNALMCVVDDYVSLIFHRFLSTPISSRINIYINKSKIKAADPFLESHPKTTTKKERTIAIQDSQGIERLIRIRPYVLPFISDLSDKDKKAVGGIESLRIKQGFYVYRNNRLIIWGTWFGMKPRAELTKNARIRVDIPNSLDDIWSIDIKKQNATIPKRIQQQLKNTVTQALDISTAKQTHRGRREKVEDNKDYVWDRMQGREETFYYLINRESFLYKYVKEKLSEQDFQYLELLLQEIERNIPVQQIYIDQANDVIVNEESPDRAEEVYGMGLTLIDFQRSLSDEPISEIIDRVMLSEPFFNYPTLKERFTENYHD